MTKLRIAIYHNLHSGGAKRVTAEHLHRLAMRHQVALFSLNSADHTFASLKPRSDISISLQEYRPLPMAHSPFGRINPLIGLLNIAYLNRLAREVAREIDSQAFDVVLAHPCQVTQTPLLLRWLRTPSLYYCHELPRRLYEQPVSRPYERRHPVGRILNRIDPLPALIQATLRHLDRQSAQAASRIVVNSNITRQNVSMAYNRDAKVCSPGVATDAFRPIRQARELFVLSVGALTPMKGFDFVIRAIGTLPVNERPPLVIISNYQEAAELCYLTDLARQLNVQVDCRKEVEDTELALWYSRAGCVAYAPIREPFGLVALEAMAAAAPIVSVADGGMVETIEDQLTGILTPRETHAFGHAIQQLLKQPGRAAELGQAARKAVLKHRTWEHHIECLETLLRQTAHLSINTQP